MTRNLRQVKGKCFEGESKGRLSCKGHMFVKCPNRGERLPSGKKKKTYAKALRCEGNILGIPHCSLLLQSYICNQVLLDGVRFEAREIYRRHVMKDFYVLLWRPPDTGHISNRGL